MGHELLLRLESFLFHLSSFPLLLSGENGLENGEYVA